MAFFTVLGYWRVPLQRFRIQLGWEHGLNKKVPAKGRAITKAQVKAKRERFENRLANMSHRSRHGPKVNELAIEVFEIDANPSEQHKILALASTLVDHAGEDVDRKLGESVRQGGRKGGRKHSNEHAQRREMWQAKAEDIWSRNRSLSKSAVARLIAQELAGNPNTIRQRIRTPIET